MEQIERRDGAYYYGKTRCSTIDDAYDEFRAEYHSTLGRDSSRRLDRVGRRTERIHGFGFVFVGDPDEPGGRVVAGRVRYRLLGLSGIHYARIISAGDAPGLTEEGFERWFDRAFSAGSGMLRLERVREKSGRTCKRLKARYR